MIISGDRQKSGVPLEFMQRLKFTVFNPEVIVITKLSHLAINFVENKTR